MIPMARPLIPGEVETPEGDLVLNAGSEAVVLMVANTYDPATPYSGAAAAASLAPNRALLTVETFGHMSYGMQPCATAMIDDYLLNGTVPAEDLTCEAG